MEQGTTAKLCECGCGQPAPIASRTITSKGHIKGQPLRFIPGHQGCKPRLFVEVGQRFGCGVVVDVHARVPRPNGDTLRAAKLICDCGSEYFSPIGDLLRPYGGTRSCGCQRRSRFNDLTGRRFGKLVVLEFAKRRQWKDSGSGKTRTQVYWLCKCDCGNDRVTAARDLTGGNTTSCGCRRRDYLGREVTPDQAARNLVLDGYKRGAVRRGLAWELTDEDFDRLTSSACFYCGCPPSRTRESQALYTKGQFTYNGIDRVDNDAGYTPGNALPACRTCNLAKKDMPFGEFMAWIARLTEYHWFHPELTPSRLLREVKG